MSNIWIGGTENLRSGDVIVGWSPTDAEGVTLCVRRWDHDTAEAVLDRVIDMLKEHELGTWDLNGIAEEFGVKK